MLLPQFPLVSVVFGIETTAILLPIDIPFLGGINAFLPSFAKIIIQKPGLGRLQITSKSGYVIMLLILGIEQRRSEKVEVALLGDLSGALHAHGITMETSIVFPIGHGPKPLLWLVFLILEDDLDAELFSHFETTIPPLHVFHKRMDVWIVKQPGHLIALLMELFERGDGAWAATDM